LKVSVTFAHRLLLACAAALATVLMLGSSIAAAAAQPGCVTMAPAVQSFKVEEAPREETDAYDQETFTKVRAAEGCNVPLVLPAGYDQMTPIQKIFWLINNEREIRGLEPYKLDTTLMQQIAYNHSKEESTYAYTGHYSPINAPVPAGSEANPLLREDALPMQKNWNVGEVIQWGTTPAATVLFWIYGDGPSWPHRNLLFTKEAGAYVGIGVFNGPPYGSYTTVDTANPSAWPFPEFPQPAEAVAAPYTPPATTDTEPPVMGQLTYAGGAATVTGVADSPKNVNDTGANPLTPGITGVVFYTNNITGPPGGAFSPGGFNTVPATQTTPGTWTAPITVNGGEVLHAVAVDGSGNFADISLAPPAMQLAAGENTMALPAATTTPAAEEGAEAANVAREAARNGMQLAVPSSAAALVRSLDARAHRKIAEWVRVYVNGHWRTYLPSRAANFPLYVGEGVVVKLKARTSWRPPAGQEPYKPGAIKLHKGWNFVAVPYPTTGMTCHAVRFELAKQRDKMLQITVGPNPKHGIFMKPNKKGQWGNDLTKHIPYGKGFWIHDTGSVTWRPSPTGYTSAKVGSVPVAVSIAPHKRP
jgi:hypothetical protein